MNTGDNNISDDIFTMIDRCNTNLTHYDVAVIVSVVFKDAYRYIGNRNWEYLNSSNEWVSDNKSSRLKMDIKTIISNLFMTRSLYWYNISSEGHIDINTEIHAKLMSQKILKAGHKLMDNKFISVVIKEARSFFDIHNND
jgi:hypothetical protein